MQQYSGYFLHANKAARLEREDRYKAAWQEWSEALNYASGENVAWCEARIHFCGLHGGLINRVPRGGRGQDDAVPVLSAAAVRAGR